MDFENSSLITNRTDNKFIAPNISLTNETIIGVLISYEQIFTLILPYSIIFLLAIIGNLLVIITLSVNRRMRSVTNIFLLNLAVSDLLLGVFCMPFTLIGVLLKQFIFGSIMCRLVSYLQGLYDYYFNPSLMYGIIFMCSSSVNFQIFFLVASNQIFFCCFESKFFRCFDSNFKIF
jgi:hypothetical protein